MSPHRQDSEPNASAGETPRCQHVRMNGARCGAPAARGKRLCQLHQVIAEVEALDRMLAPNGEATARQLALWQVMRVLQGPALDYKACRLMLYALQISLANRKNFAAERRERERLSKETDQRKEKSGEQRRRKQGTKGWIN